MESRAIPRAAYEPLLLPAADDVTKVQHDHHSRKRRRTCFVVAASAVVALVVVASALAGGRMGQAAEDAAGGFPWTNDMLQWQRAGYHFQPAERMFMSDPNGE